MTDEDELTPAAAPIPMWIEKAVERAMDQALRLIDDGCAAREARMLESEARILKAISSLRIEQLKLAQKVTEAAHHTLRNEFDAHREQTNARLKELERRTEPCPPPEGAE